MAKLPGGLATETEEAELTRSPRQHGDVGVQQPEATI